jgi:hypothetical protein
MGRLLSVGVAIASCLLIWKSGALDSVIGQQAAPPLDPGPIISKSGDAMRSLKSVHLSLQGTLVLNGIAGVKVSGSGELTYPHNEKLSLQLTVPAAPGQPESVVAINERLENGRTYVQIPAQGAAWKDVTNDQKGQVAPGMDPIANLEFARAFRASDDQGDMRMDNIAVHHFSLEVDPGRYVAQLKEDPQSAITPQDEAVLSNAGIHVDVWVAASDLYVHQMRVEMTTSQFTWDLTYQFSNFVSGGAPATA